MKKQRLLEAIVVLVIGGAMLATGWMLLNNADFSAFIFFPISICLLLLGVVALISALISK